MLSRLLCSTNNNQTLREDFRTSAAPPPGAFWTEIAPRAGLEGPRAVVFTGTLLQVRKEADAGPQLQTVSIREIQGAGGDSGEGLGLVCQDSD